MAKKPVKRTPYRRDRRPDISAIEARRKKLRGVTQGALAERAGMDRVTYWRMVHSGVAFARKITALRMALRSIEQERKRKGELFP